MDSNHDSQIQSLESYQLDDPGAVRPPETSLARDGVPPIVRRRARPGRRMNFDSLAKVQTWTRAGFWFVAAVRALRLSVKLSKHTVERCPSGLRSTLGKRV